LSQSRGLIPQGRDWAYDIEGQVLNPAGKDRILISEEGHDCKRRKISILPLKLDESQALVQDKEDGLAH
jgi:hypothetical protein